MRKWQSWDGNPGTSQARPSLCPHSCRKVAALTCPQPVNPCCSASDGAAGTRPGSPEQAQVWASGQGHRAAWEPATFPVTPGKSVRGIGFIAFVVEKRKKTRQERKEDGADSCRTPPVWLSQQCREASLASEQNRRDLQIGWSFSAWPARAGAVMVTRTRGNGLLFSSSPGCSLYPLPPCDLPMLSKGHLFQTSQHSTV